MTAQVVIIFFILMIDFVWPEVRTLIGRMAIQKNSTPCKCVNPEIINKDIGQSRECLKELLIFVCGRKGSLFFYKLPIGKKDRTRIKLNSFRFRFDRE